MGICEVALEHQGEAEERRGRNWSEEAERSSLPADFNCIIIVRSRSLPATTIGTQSVYGASQASPSSTEQRIQYALLRSNTNTKRAGFNAASAQRAPSSMQRIGALRHFKVLCFEPLRRAEERRGRNWSEEAERSSLPADFNRVITVRSRSLPATTIGTQSVYGAPKRALHLRSNTSNTPSSAATPTQKERAVQTASPPKEPHPPCRGMGICEVALEHQGEAEERRGRNWSEEAERSSLPADFNRVITVRSRSLPATTIGTQSVYGASQASPSSTEQRIQYALLRSNTNTKRAGCTNSQPAQRAPSPMQRNGDL
ncbi:hypothetical protein [Paenibacillus sp. 453mf]|uniref:Uncharacterized protein n=1 Tax=Paenibacillus provencensis TaxID=441151 RepID=A0ABW3PUE5_9BACL|nr:hypothetical protein [Paenibacillus sp. 453mf]